MPTTGDSGRFLSPSQDALKSGIVADHIDQGGERGRSWTMFRDRAQAGRRLADRLVQRLAPEPVVVLGLPRGGIPVAAEVAAALHAPLEVFVARKIGAPGHEELGIGAIAEGSDEVVVTDTAARMGIGTSEMQQLAAVAQRELQRRVDAYRQGRKLPDLIGRTVVLVDDGLATGVTAEAALRSLRAHEPKRLILAIPVCADDTRHRLTALADEVICLSAQRNFVAVGQWYDRFEQTTDQEVLDLLAAGRARAPGS
jgi:putative phosphoribosyl transferase